MTVILLAGCTSRGDELGGAVPPTAPAVAVDANDPGDASGSAPAGGLDEQAATAEAPPAPTDAPPAVAPTDAAADIGSEAGSDTGGVDGDAGDAGAAPPAADAAPPGGSAPPAVDAPPGGSAPPAVDAPPAGAPPPAVEADAGAGLERPAGWVAEDPATYPLSIERLRGLSYPGSDLVVVEELPAGGNYSRAVATYRSEGLTIRGLLTIPNGEPPGAGWPIVIFNHGYIPPAQYRTTERYVAYQDAFARAGYITFKSDYRGHGSSEGEAGGGRGSPDYTIDVLNAMASVARHPAADENRIGMWGHSMGGSITLRSMVLSRQIKAGVIWAGVVASYPDMYNGLGRSSPPGGNPSRRGWRMDLVESFGTPEENPAAWDAVSPNAYLAEISGPLQLHHGTNDTSVPVAYSTRLQEQMDAAGRPSEIFVYEGDDHNLSRSLSTALARSVEFFNRHLGGG